MIESRLFRRYVLIGLGILSMQASFASAALLTLQPGTASVTPGDPISMNLVVSGLGDHGADSLGGFDISIAFDATVLSYTSYSLGDYLGDPGLFEAIDVSAGDSGGAVNVAQVSFLSGSTLDVLQPAEFVLATLRFDVAALATSTLTLLQVSPRSALIDAFGAPIAISQRGSARVQVTTAVPAPGTVLLLGAAVLGWGASRKTHRIALRKDRVW